MKKKIVILGSTGSIGKSTLSVVRKDKKNFDLILLTANNNYKELIRQAKDFNVKNVIINNKKYFSKVKNSLRKTKTKVFTGDASINQISEKKIDFSISAIVGLAGLQPTVDVMKISKNVAIANKETIICAWNILSELKKKYNTNIIPIDSEHFSIMELTKNFSDADIKEIIITASGGPFLNSSLKKLNNVKPKQAIKHPNWSMGKKISVDSANLMNKVFEVVEAHKIFNFNKNKYKIIIHPQSYVHSIIYFKNGLVKLILYEADMEIPIFNILYEGKKPFYNTKTFDTRTLNEMSFKKVNPKIFPAIKLVKKCLNLGPSTSIIVNASNEVLVNLFLKGKIDFLDIVKTINKILKDKEFNKYAKKKARTIKDIKFIDNWARLKTTHMCVR